ncbi:MAG: VanW family protein [Actinomycetia bacterium]|nr:VanW family protein [Actinomycetes bacterium]
MKLPTRIILASVATVILLLGAVSYVRDQSTTPDVVARNVTVGGVAVGGLNTADATLALSAHENALLSSVGVFTVNGHEFRLSPASVELDVDVPAGVDAAMRARRTGTFVEKVQSWFSSFISTEAVALPIFFNDEVILAELDIWESIAVERPAFDGSITVDDGEVITRYPLPGVGVNRETGTALIRSKMSTVGTAPALIPVVNASSPLSNDQLDAAAAQVREMITDPVALRSDDATFRMTFTERQLASAVRATIDPASDSIEVYFDRDAVLDILEPLRREFEISPIDARFDIDLNTGEYTVIPGRSGVVLDIETLLTELKSAALGSGTGVFPVVVGARPKLTTQEATAFTTMTKLGGFSTKYTQGQDRTLNIQRMSDDVDGTVVLAGEVFSINDHVGQRVEADGYVAAPAIINGAPYCCDHPANIGGGVSQFATTLFNAAFFSCLEDVEHQPHSLYFTRYPRGREATLGVPGPDVKFRNNTDFPVVIRSWYSGESVSVRIYGFNGGLECESDTHDKEDIVAFEKEYVADPDIAPGQQRRERSGIDGFLQRVDRIVTSPDGSTEEDLHLIWRYRPLSELWSVNPCEVSGEPVNCPFTLGSVIGSTWEAALDALANQGLKVAKALEGVTDPGKDNIVLDQNPARGTPVKPGETITLTVGSYAGDSDG